jgi:hypothetical protein
MGHSDRPVRNCQHLTVHHEHGSQAGYTQDGCRCTRCTNANTVAKRQHRTALAYGTGGGLVDAAPARKHVEALRTAGFSLQQIVQASGVAQGAVNALVYGAPARNRPPSGQVRADTAQRLLACDPATTALPDGSRVTAAGTRRRLQALACAGWSTPALADRTTLTRRTLTRLLTGTANSVTAGTARTVAALHERLRLAPPPQLTPLQRALARQTAAAAQAAGWRAPRAWHDIDHDPDPTRSACGPQDADRVGCADLDDLGGAARPGDEPDVDEVAVERVMRGEPLRLNLDERLEVVHRLTRRGVSAREIAQRLHTTSRTVVRLRGVLRGTAAA